MRSHRSDALSTQRSRTARAGPRREERRPAALVLARSFDDGSLPVPARLARREHDLPAARALETVEYDIAARNPGYRPPDEAGPLAPPSGPPAQEAAAAPAASASPAPEPPHASAAPGQAPVARAASNSTNRAFTERQLAELIGDEALRADLQSMLQPKAAAASAGAAPRSPPPEPAAGARAPAAAPPATPSRTEPSSEHAIFDRIAQNMRYATAYDLGSVDLERRFDDFDRVARAGRGLPLARAKGASTAAPAVAPPPPAPAALAAHPHAGEKDWPKRPENLRTYTAKEHAEHFGSFDYEADPTPSEPRNIKILGSWISENIVGVDIPQLEGKKGYQGKPVRFHRNGRDALVKLWQDWEKAGLLDRIVSFEGAFNPRFIGGTTDLSTHAFGIAFDVNAGANARGDVPALAGEPGSVRELVEIANQNGFFWGGHYRSKPDGMHFELGKAV